MGGVVDVEGVSGDDGVEVGFAAVGFGAEQAAETLGFFLAGAEGSGHLDGDSGFG